MFNGELIVVAPLDPEEVEKLRGLVKWWCGEYGCDPDGRLARDRARKMLLAYSAGVRERSDLLGLVRPF
jgi:hypothetical protein